MMRFKISRAYKALFAAALLKQQKEHSSAIVSENEIEEKFRLWRAYFKEILLIRDPDGNNFNANFLKRMMGIGFLSGVLIGGYQKYLYSLGKFVRTNHTTMFLSKNLAQRELVQSTMGPIVLQSLLTGIKYSILTSAMIYVSTVVVLYRGEDGILEYFIAGGVTNALRKCNLGIRGMFSGFVFGSIAGTMLGLFIWPVSKLFGTTVSQLKVKSCLLDPNYINTASGFQKFMEADNFSRVYELERGHLPAGFTLESDIKKAENKKTE